MSGDGLPREGMTPWQVPASTLELLEVSWRARSTTMPKILVCGLFRTETGIEVRVGYSDDDIRYTSLLGSLEAARARANDLRTAIHDTKAWVLITGE